MKAEQVDLRNLIANYPDFPKKGILFRDINPVYRRIEALNFIADQIYERFASTKVDAVAGIESRGFVVATAVALKFGKGMIMIRKGGKLPGDKIERAYDIEYGSAIMEMQQNAVTRGENILIADDLVATGGTAVAAAQLVEQLGGIVTGFAFVIELLGLGGAEKLRKLGYTAHSLVKYDL